MFKCLDVTLVTTAVCSAMLFLFYLLGDYGKLGHGNNVTQKLPRLILGPFTAKVCIPAFIWLSVMSLVLTSLCYGVVSVSSALSSYRRR